MGCGLRSRTCDIWKRQLPSASAGICTEVDLQLSGDLVVNQGEQLSETCCVCRVGSKRQKERRRQFHLAVVCQAYPRFIALVGLHGHGKSSILKMFGGELLPGDGDPSALNCSVASED